MDVFPIFLKLHDEPCLVVGGGEVAARKTGLLLQAGARVTVVAPQLGETLAEWVSSGTVAHHSRTFRPEDLEDSRLVIAATNNEVTNRHVSDLARRRSLPVNVVDRPELCSFVMGSIVDRSPLVAAVSSGGAAPVLARLLRARMETLIPTAYGRLAQLAHAFRDKVKARVANTRERRVFWERTFQGPIAEMVFAGRDRDAEKALEAELRGPSAIGSDTGEVYLVGAGPGDPDLLTFRALRLMQQADVVVYDRLVAPSILDLARRDADRIYVGKERNHHAMRQEEINRLLARLAKEGKRVCRLKGGDPFIFGRGGEEIDTLAAQGVPFQVVPGITAASGCSAYAGIPLTHRDHAQSCVFVTGHLKDGSMNLNWPMLAQPKQTVVFYMGLLGLEILCRELMAHGAPSERPAALIQQGTTHRQRIYSGTLKTLPQTIRAREIHPPTLIVVGDVVRLHEKLAWFESDQGESETTVSGPVFGHAQEA
jgi:uroporphyrin-III C-methyltransferase/precorrin-2 dehydrogenase/sirohydrochlorin ferrochelatase